MPGRPEISWIVSSFSPCSRRVKPARPFALAIFTTAKSVRMTKFTCFSVSMLTAAIPTLFSSTMQSISDTIMKKERRLLRPRLDHAICGRPPSADLRFALRLPEAASA